ncbi:conserved oligomeric Golgi complex subunit 3 [Oratosquilla oratoria]|uniref:conserved oligomeric Golgi complex subunit 3 n=1 Tax=Oratosquilla oratoria TaxID=337810 RepID=UPI003F759FC8
MEDVADVNIALVRQNLSNWEDGSNPLSPLTPEERDSIIELTSIAGERPFPVGVEAVEGAGGEASDTGVGLCEGDSSSTHQELAASFAALSLGEKKIESSQQFLTWFASVEEEMGIEQDSPYRDYVNQLQGNRQECHTLLSQLDDALQNLQTLSDQYTSVSNKTNALHTDCEHLLAEQTRLANKADTIENKLAYFLEVQKISQKLSSPAFQVTNDGFIPLLAKIDECISYMNSNQNFQESSLYLAKYKHCLSRALGMVKSYVTKSLENATQEVIPKPGSEKPTTDNAAILFYGKFRTNAPRIKSLMAEIEDRVENSPEYTNLLSDCHQCYFAQRQVLLGPCVTEAVTDLAQKYQRDYCSLVRSGCAFLVHVCEDEYALFHQFFTAPTPELDIFLRGLCTGLYDVLRPLVIHIDHLETLSELCNILRRGIIEEHIQNNPTQLAPLVLIVNQMLEDAQERLVYRAHIYVQSDILNFRPSPGDLAYPAKLEMMESIAESIAASHQNKIHSRNDSVTSMSSVRSATSEEVAHINAMAEERFTRVGSSPADLHGMWYPTVRRTLMCLSKLYRCVDRSIFQGISQEALAACMQNLESAASIIRKASSPLDAQLFEIKHLLILREQLAPFQVDSCLRETSLDWSKIRSAAVGLIHKRNRLFSFSSNNALLEFIVEGTPQVTEHILDSKRDVDNRLKRACEQLIYTATESLTTPLSTFITKAEVILKMNKDESVKPIALKNQPFASPEKLSDVISLTQKNTKTNLPHIQRSMQLYLANRDTEFILFKPIRLNVLSTFSRAQAILAENYNEEEVILVGCPSQEEVSALLASLFKS